ncbi:MAG TPA: cytochrome P450 [Natronosporangium sp.]|nr:cytochrome P450 [Natronosporangium sp.]
MSRARRRDRRVYLASHPILFGLVSATRIVPMIRLGRTVLVHAPEPYRQVLTRLPLDRTAAGTTGGAIRQAGGGGAWFDQQGQEHRAARRRLAEDLSAAGVARLRPVWRAVLDRRTAPLRHGDTVELVDLATELAGVTVKALLRLPEHVDARALAEAAAQVGAAGVREHLPGRRRPGQAAQAAAALRRLLGESVSDPEGMLAVAAVNTTVAGLPRAVAWCADDQLWSAAADPAQRAPLVNELLRVVAPSPLLPRAAAADGTITGKRVRAGDRLVLVARHAADAHRHDPDPVDPQPPQVAQLVFGAGPHACPGAGLARAQLDDVLRTLAPYRPVVVRARAARRSALPGWAELEIRAAT